MVSDVYFNVAMIIIEEIAFQINFFTFTTVQAYAKDLYKTFDELYH